MLAPRASLPPGRTAREEAQACRVSHDMCVPPNISQPLTEPARMQKNTYIR